MQLDVMNRITGVKKPSDVFKTCPNQNCENADLLVFEAEVFCLKCNWDSVAIHAEVLAEVQLRRLEERASGQARVNRPISRGSAPYLHLFLPRQSPGRTVASSSGQCPEVA